MKSLLALLILTFFFLGSCAHPDAGLYTSRGGEMLKISRGGHLEWSPSSKSMGEFQTIGILAKPDSQGDRHLVTASAHPLLGTSVHFSPDGKIIDVTWRSFFKRPLPDLDTHYRKSEPRPKP